MKKIVIALTVLFFLTGCQSTKDTKTTSQITQEEKQEEQNQEQEKTKQETKGTEEGSKPETKEEQSKTKETKQQEETTSTQSSSSSESVPPTASPPASVSPAVETKKYVTISIDCKTILNNMDTFKEQYKSFVPSSGVILVEAKIEYASGDTVLSLLKKVTKEKGIRIINQGGYISNIANINQMGMQNGQGGWMYQVNGVLGDTGADAYKVSNGDVVQWRYTCYPGDI